ncbi:hypothetical protein D9615_003355 [Tricholomella constricta]|uniref:Beta-lactamase-related domain-containing protein n=1 Tax=Tricholomella constricta TaxID=117010 RepID=A0A8H5HIW6_9AGAR|nr:hypothetical protein D9615_003355 [Tricholomella constricta]
MWVRCEKGASVVYKGKGVIPVPTQSDAVESKRTPGLVFGATSVEKELFFTHAGPRLFDDPSGGPMSDDSIFWICSQTKMLASIAAFQLIEAGKLQLDTVVADILPELANPVVLNSNGPDAQPNFVLPKTAITVRHLLNHSSGLDYGPEADRVCEYHLPSPYTASHDKLNPVKHFFNLRKVRKFTTYYH